MSKPDYALEILQDAVREYLDARQRYDDATQEYKAALPDTSLIRVRLKAAQGVLMRLSA